LSDSYLDDVAQPDGPSALAQVMVVINNWRDLCKRVENKAAELEELQKQERIFNEQTIPNLLLQHGLESLTLSELGPKGDPLKITVTEDLSVSLPKKDQDARKVALAWLENNGAGDIIKDLLSIEDPEDWIKATLKEHGVGFMQDRDVNAASLKAWVKRALGMTKNTIASVEPDAVPPELGLYRYKRTKIS
jgi:hypothetical protein